jgi:hypothetical protein
VFHVHTKKAFQVQRLFLRSPLLWYGNGLEISWETAAIAHVRFEILTAVVMKSTIFWNITPCSPLKVKPTFRSNISSTSSVVGRAQLSTFHAGFLISLFFDPEDGSDMFLRNVS